MLTITPFRICTSKGGILMSTKLPIRTCFASVSGQYEFVFHPLDQTQSPSIVRRTTFIDRCPRSKYYSRTPWLYYYKESKDSPPILLNRHEAGNIVDCIYHGFDLKWDLQSAKDRFVEIVYSEFYTDNGCMVYNEIYKGSNYKRGFLKPIPGEHSDIYYIVEKRVYRDGRTVYSEPVFIHKARANSSMVYHQNIIFDLSRAERVFTLEGD